MSEFPFERVLEFVREVIPFDSLGREKLEEVVSAMEIDFYPAGEVVLQAGGPPSRFLYIIQSGSARVSLPREGEDEILVDIRGEGDVFGALSLLQGGRALFQVTAREDMICYLLPEGPFRELVEGQDAFRRHFRSSLARNIQSMLQGPECSLPGPSGLPSLPGLDAALVRSPVGELMSHPVLVCLPHLPVRQAAALMSRRRVGSIVVTEESGRPLGILTDSDIRVRVVAQGQETIQPVARFMSRPVHTISPRAYGFEALLAMSRHDVQHLVVTEGGRVVGLLSDHDLRTLTGGSPVAVVRDIEKVTSVAELVSLHVRIDRVLEMLLRLGGSARNMLELVTEFNDRLTVKLVELTLEELEQQGQGRPPVPWEWLALGSEGRREQTLRTDQDNAIIFANVSGEHRPAIQQWFLKFAEKVVAGLEACGFPRCQGGVMAVNPRWCQTERQWAETFRGWIDDPNPRTLRLASIFFDYRSIYSEFDLLEALDAALDKAMEGNRLFLRAMARNALYNRPPLGFFRQFVVEKGGEHRNKLNLKLSGLTPVVDAVRVMALDLAATASRERARLHEQRPHGLLTNTLERLDEITRRGLLKDEFAADLREAFSFITILRITQHLEARARGEMPDNFVAPARLNNLQRKMLKESFAVIRRLQDLLEHRYQTRLLT